MVTNPRELDQMRAATAAWYAEMRRQAEQPGITWVYACELKAPHGLDQTVFGPPDAMQLQRAAYSTLTDS